MKNLISFLKETIIQAGELALKIRLTNLEIQYKQDSSPVSNADILVENFITTQLNKISSTPIISEENQYLYNTNLNAFSDYNDYFWLIDPIDGSKNFIKNGKIFTINIALIKNYSPILGIIYLPYYKKLYYTDENNKFQSEHYKKQSPNYINNFDLKKPIAVLGNKKINSQTKKYLQDNSLNQIIYTPSSIKLCLIAEGVADIYPKFGPTMEWDLAAGQILIKATGGQILDLNNQELIYGKNNFKNPHVLAMSKKYLIQNHIS